MSDQAFAELCARLSAALEAAGSGMSADHDPAMGEWSLTRVDGEQFYLGRSYDDEVVVSLLGLNGFEFDSVRDSQAIVDLMVAFVQDRVVVRRTRNPFARRLQIQPANGEPTTLAIETDHRHGRDA